MIEVAAYYEAQQSGLGRRFLASVQDAVNRAVLNPDLYPTAGGTEQVKELNRPRPQ